MAPHFRRIVMGFRTLQLYRTELLSYVQSQSTSQNRFCCSAMPFVLKFCLVDRLWPYTHLSRIKTHWMCQQYGSSVVYLLTPFLLFTFFYPCLFVWSRVSRSPWSGDGCCFVWPIVHLFSLFSYTSVLYSTPWSLLLPPLKGLAILEAGLLCNEWMNLWQHRFWNLFSVLGGGLELVQSDYNQS